MVAVAITDFILKKARERNYYKSLTKSLKEVEAHIRGEIVLPSTTFEVSKPH